MICLYLYEYLLLWDIPYIIGNELMSTFQCKFNHVNQSSCSWDINKWRFYSYWWPDILIVCCCFCTSHICADSPHSGLFSATLFMKISLLVMEIQAEWSLWHRDHYQIRVRWYHDNSSFWYENNIIKDICLLKGFCNYFRSNGLISVFY